MIRKYLIPALLALSVSGLVYGLWQRSEVSRLLGHTQALENRLEALSASHRAIDKSLQALERDRRAANNRAREAERNLNEALSNDRDWAARPIPDGLCQALPGCGPS